MFRQGTLILSGKGSALKRSHSSHGTIFTYTLLLLSYQHQRLTERLQFLPINLVTLDEVVAVHDIIASLMLNECR